MKKNEQRSTPANKYIIEPLRGVGPVRFGMARTEVLDAMPRHSHPFRKTGASLHETDAFHQSCFQVFYRGSQNSPVVDFIELSGGGEVEAWYRELNVFSTPADEVRAYFSQFAPFDPAEPEIPHTYAFPSLELTLWREYVPKSGRDKQGRYFDTIGIGRKGYLAQSRKGFRNGVLSLLKSVTNLPAAELEAMVSPGHGKR